MEHRLKNTTLFFTLLILTAILMPAAVAAGNVTLTFSDMGLGSNQRILIYAPDAAALNESFLGEYNTSATVSLLGEKNYVIALKPGPSHWFENPLNGLELFKAALPPLVTAALFLGVILCILGLFYHMFRK